jgi:hypothetical protein
MGQLRYLFIVVILSLFGFSCGGGGWEKVAEEVSGNSSPEVHDNSAPAGESSVLKTSSAPYLGAGMFAVNHPSFDRETAIDILRASSSPVISFIPNIFGSDSTNYRYILDTLIDEGIGPHVQMYVLCGPCRRPRRDGSLVQFRPDLDIEGLQNAIRWNDEIRSQYIDYVTAHILPLVEAYPQLNFTVVPELEDNQVDDSFSALLDLTMLVLGNKSNVRFKRNPLHFTGNRTFNGQVVAIELHTVHMNDINMLMAGDTVSIDGYSYAFRGEQVACQMDTTIEHIELLVSETRARGISFQLWRHDWQGLPMCGGYVPHPINRTYTFTYVDQIKQLLSK